MRAFALLATYRRNQAQLLEAPPARAPQATLDAATVHALVDAALADGRELLDEPEAKALLAAYGIPVVGTSAVPDDTRAAQRRRRRSATRWR